MGSISGLIGILAFVGVLMFLGGIGLAVVASSQGRPVRGSVMLSVVGLVAFLIFTVVSQGIVVVLPTQAGVVFNQLTGELTGPLRSGTHIIIPVVQQVTLYPLETQQYTVSGTPGEGQVQGDDAVRGRSIDGQEVLLDLTVLYRIDPDKITLVHTRWQDRYQNDFIRPTLRTYARDALSLYNAEELYGSSRDALQKTIQDEMTARLAEDGFILTDLLVRNITFTPEFASAIEDKQIAEQNRLRQEQESERVRIEAEGQRDAAIAQAEGDARAIVLKAQANAEALRLVSQQIAANPNLIQYLYVQNLGDNIRIALVPANSPLLFDSSTFTQLSPDFTPPAVPDVNLPSATETPVPGSSSSSGG